MGEKLIDELYGRALKATEPKKILPFVKHLLGKNPQETSAAKWKHVLGKSELFEEIKHPDQFKWFLVRNVDIKKLKPGTRTDWKFDPDLSEEEIDENLERYDDIENAIIHGSEIPWPIVVSEEGMILDGYHRLTVMSDHEFEEVDVLWARRKNTRS